MSEIIHIGIDYGAKKAGTTAICFLSNNQLKVLISDKGKDADLFLKNTINEINPDYVFIDAPLSLPRAYYEGNGDFHYRKCDKDLKAMSPMFLGGLTARAISIKNELNKFEFYETYPKQLAHIIDKNNYKNNLEEFTSSIINYSNYEIMVENLNWHKVDSILAWLSGYRFINKKAIEVGDENEGIIVF